VIFRIASPVEVYSVQAGGSSTLVVATPSVADHEDTFRRKVQALAESSVERAVWLNEPDLERHA